MQLFVTFLSFTERLEVWFHDVQDAIVIHKSSKTLKVAKELLFFLVMARFIKIGDKDYGTRVKARPDVPYECFFTDEALVFKVHMRNRTVSRAAG